MNKSEWTPSLMGKKGIKALNKKLGKQGRIDRATKASLAAAKSRAKNKADNYPQGI